jgi:HPt (histidine-containing phosphotransfer) domain-containing protein
MAESSFAELKKAEASAVASAEQKAPEILDYDALIDRCLGNIDLVERLLNKLQTCIPQDIEKVEKAFALQDAGQVASIAHRLKGATANVAARGLNRLAEEIENLGKSGTLQEMPSLIEQLHQEWERFKNYSITFIQPR